MPDPNQIEEQRIEENWFLEDLKFVKSSIHKWFVNNVVQRTLSHLVGWTGDKAKMLLCTTTGILKVAPTGSGYERHLVHNVTGADTYTYLDWTDKIPSRMYIECRDYDALVSFCTELGVYDSDIRVRAGEARQIERTAYKMRYKNQSVGNNASLHIEGYY